MFVKEFKILKQHGWQYVPDVAGVQLPETFRGRPVIKSGLSAQACQKLCNLCPSDAIEQNPMGIDLGKCVFCKECVFEEPDYIKFTNDYQIAGNCREDLIIKEGTDNPIRINPEKIRKEIRKFFKRSIKLRQVSAAGDNSCEMELNAAGNVNFDMGHYGISFVASPRHADGLVITGPISQNMAEALQICYDATPEPKLIILVGTDALSGGIFQDSPAIDRSFLEKYHVDLYVPGNPAHPLTFINGVRALIEK